MAYTPFNADWKDYPDVTTPITQAALEYIEAGITATAVVADGAVPKSLIDAKGDGIFGSAADTAVRVAVGANGTFLKADSTQTGGVAWAAAPTASLVTALPGSPVDGDECILVDSLTAPTYQWRLRYISAATTYKWYFIGGIPALTTVDTSETTTSTSYAALATAGPSFTTPVAGDWLVGQMATVVNSGGGQIEHMSFDVGGTGASDNDSLHCAAGGTFSLVQQRKKTAISASTALVSKYKTSTGTGTWSKRIMLVTPIRVN